MAEFSFMHQEEKFEPPSYSDPGRVLVHIIGPGEMGVYEYESEVLDHDGCTFWIQEGTGFDFWLDSFDFDSPGYYVIEGIVGCIIRGDGWESDDDERWSYKSVRKATPEEIVNQTFDK